MTGLTPCSAPASLRARLDAAYERYNDRKYLGTDPLQVVHRYECPDDREVAALISACLAYGNVKAILRGIDDVLSRMDGRPAAWLRSCGSRRPIDRALRGFRYRVTPDHQMAGLLVGARELIRCHGSLGKSFIAHVRDGEPDVLPAVSRWVRELSDAAGTDLPHLLPSPERGSACKRLNLMLRWLVRRDEIDVGGWEPVGAHRLVVPLDTHMHRVARLLRLTARRQPNLATAVQITEALRAIHPDDPMRYDFALTRPGIMRDPTPDGGLELDPGDRHE